LQEESTGIDGAVVAAYQLLCLRGGELMKANVVGRLRNTVLRPTQSLQPLYEAVTNSIQAIEALPDQSLGTVKIFIKRDLTQQTDTRFRNNPIVDISIEDNGIGFNHEHFESFNTADSPLKQNIGGKGVGRFIWLKAFSSVRVESNYEENGKWFCREFNFLPTEKGVEGDVSKPLPHGSRRTTVTLKSLQKNYQDNCMFSPEAIARKLIQRFMTYFLFDHCPKMELHDVEEPTFTIVNDEFRSIVKPDIKESRFKIKNHQFEVKHICVHSKAIDSHSLHFCANKLEVMSVKLDKFAPALMHKLKDSEGKSFTYQGYVQGTYLNQRVNQERTEFNMSNQLHFEDTDGITDRELINHSVDCTLNHLNPYLADIRNRTRDRIHEIISTRAPEYRPLMKNIDGYLDSISPHSTADDILSRLNEIQFEMDTLLKKNSEEMLSKISKLDDIPEFSARFAQLVEKVSDNSKSRLAQYVTLRRMVLEILFRRLQTSEKGKYFLEEHVHELVFPKFTTSDDVDHENQNLWIIDEKLSYHHFLASDIPLRNIEEIDSDSRKEPDIIVLNKRLAFTDSENPINSIVIVEFKRPGGSDRNPIDQVLEYISEIRNNRVKRSNGRPISILKTTPFYCYIICDLTEKIIFKASQTLTQTPDGMGWFGYIKDPWYAYMEIISFDKLVSDARKRNQVFFDKLALPKLEV
jgi:hypothetical protein